jgi:separase
VLLFGCSSGRLRQRGAFGSQGTALSYLAAGCPTLLACLWDVTDGDCDRFSRAVLDDWLAGDASLPRAVASARSACRLPHLVGAAPIVYGLPLSARPLH